MKEAIKVVPDVGIQDAEGKLVGVYDYKFDDLDTNYQDDWQKKQKQQEAYRHASNSNPKKVDNRLANVTRKAVRPPALDYKMEL